MFNFFKKPDFKFREILNGLPDHTPDMYILEQYADGILLFEYGNPLEDPRICTAYTEENYALWQFQGHDPIAMKLALPTNSQRKARVSGTVYYVSKERLVELDNVRLNGVNYERKRIRLILDQVNAEGQPQNLHAFAYIGVIETWKEQIIWDNQFYRGKGEFRLAETQEDLRRPWLRHYHVHRSSKPFDRKCWIGDSIAIETSESSSK